MDPIKQLAIIDDIFRQLDTGRNTRTDQQHIQDTHVYSCPRHAARELQVLFKEQPQIIGMSADLPNNNSFFALDDFGVPVLATRDSEGKFHAFINACRHRGVRVNRAERGTAAGFSCPFHGWAYSNTGELKGVRREKDFGEVDKGCNGLVALPALEQAGFLIVHPQPTGQIDGDELFGELAQEFVDFGSKELVFQGSSSLDMKLNWKLANDTFGETYHFAILHKDTLGRLLHGDVCHYEEYGHSHRFVIIKRSIDELREPPKRQWRLRDHATLVYFLFPNVQCIFNEVGVSLVRMYPDPENPGRSVSRISHYLNAEVVAALAAAGKADVDASNAYDIDARNGTKLISPEVANEIFDSTIEKEDYAMGVQAQAAIEGGHQQQLIFGCNEPALQHFHRAFDQALKSSIGGRLV